MKVNLIFIIIVINNIKLKTNLETKIMYIIKYMIQRIKLIKKLGIQCSCYFIFSEFQKYMPFLWIWLKTN